MGAFFYLVFGGIGLLGIIGIATVVVILIRALMKHVHGVEPSKHFADNPPEDAPRHRAQFTDTPSAGTTVDLLAPALAAGAAAAVADALLPETEPCADKADFFSSSDEGSSQCDASSSSDDSGSSSSSD